MNGTNLEQNRILIKQSHELEEIEADLRRIADVLEELLNMQKEKEN